MAWTPPLVRQWGIVSRYWCRLSSLNSFRLNKRIATWANAKANPSVKNWFYLVRSKITELNLTNYIDIGNHIAEAQLVNKVTESMMRQFTVDWIESIQRPGSLSGRGRNKLRTYCLLKKEFTPEKYCTLILPHAHRSALCKFRCGVAPIRIETGRYENLPVSDRVCHFCNVTEDECHVILDCAMYNDIRKPLLDKAIDICQTFCDKQILDKLVFLLTHPDLIRLCAKTCFLILKQRSVYLCK